MKTRHVLFGMILVLISGTAASAEWLKIGRSEDKKTEVFVDLTSIVAERNIRRAWTKYDYAQRTQEVAGHEPAKWIDYSLTRKAINCAEQMSMTEATTLYFEDGTTESVPELKPVGAQRHSFRTRADARTKVSQVGRPATWSGLQRRCRS